MRLSELHIKGFRRIEDATIKFGDSTFIIGANNVGKSTILRAIEILLTATEKLADIEYHSYCPEGTTENECKCDEIVFEAEFINVPTEAHSWKGFKGRIIPYQETHNGETTTGNKIVYRKIYPKGSKCQPAMLCMEKTLKNKYSSCTTAQDLIDAGCDAALISREFPTLSEKIASKAGKTKIEYINELWEVDEKIIEWDKNPGGIAQNVISRLPDYVFIPADDGSGEINNKNGALITILKTLFNDVREKSEHYRNAQAHLTLLANELNPNDETSDFGILMNDLNTVMKDIFPESSIHIGATLDGPEALKPDFNIAMSSNIRTPVSYQGTGMVRSAVFALLRFRNKWLKERGESKGAGLVIGFEEPELYLHPNAANQMRDTIYELSEDYSQIVCTTHSPFMIDLSRKPRQILNSSNFEGDTIAVSSFNVSNAFKNLQEDSKPYVKMLLKMDDYVSRIFFSRLVILVEGDTEDIVMRETFKRLPSTVRRVVYSEVQVIKARGKGALIPLIKYLNLLNIKYIVLHDRDGGTPKAEVMNPAIANTLSDNGRRIMLSECIEDLLGYPAPNSEKPFTAFRCVSAWGQSWNDIPAA